MSTQLPDTNRGVVLRPARELSHVPTEEPATVRAAPQPAAEKDSAEAASSTGEVRLLGITLSVAAVASLSVAVWMLERRRRLRQPPDPSQRSELPAEQRPPVPARAGVPAAKKLMKLLLWVRTVGGAAAILAAIAIVVFWAIELVDRSSKEPGLTTALMIVLATGWAVFWLSGRAVNMVHRSFFGRAHPIFAD